MKKKTFMIGTLLLAMNCFSQTDTLAESVSGKEKIIFNYQKGKITRVISPYKYVNYIFKIKKDEFLYLDLFDGVAKDTLYFMERKITVYFRNGETDSFTANSESNTFQFKGDEVKKIIVYKPKEK